MQGAGGATQEDGGGVRIAEETKKFTSIHSFKCDSSEKSRILHNDSC